MFSLKFMSIFVLAVLVSSNSMVSMCMADGATIADETQLHTDLLQDYSNKVRPNQTVTINMIMTLKNLIDLDIVNEQMIVSGSLLVQWSDYRLRWAQGDHKNITVLYFTVDEVWRPLMVLSNGADAIYVIGDDSDQRSIPIIASSYGKMFWIAPAFFKSICSIDVSMFPFDTQKCEIIISSWMFDIDVMAFTMGRPEVVTSHYKENGEYHLLRTYTEIREVVALNEEPWAYAVFVLEFQRRYSYYVMNMMVPVLFLEILGVLVFALPATSGEKLSYALTLLLSLVVMISIVAETIPSTSLHVPLLGTFVLEGVALSVMEVLFVVYILNLQNWHDSGKPLGHGHKLFLSLVLRRGCCNKNKVDRQQDVAEDIPKLEDIGKDKMMRGSVSEPYAGHIHDSGYTGETSCTYEDIAKTVERFCFWLFSTLVIVFLLQAIIYIYVHQE